jgi:hypothetical protein
MERFDLLERAAFWRLGFLDPEQLRDVAYECIEADLDCQEMRTLAGDARLGLDEARERFPLALRALGLEMPSEDAARRIVCHSLARSIVAGALDPVEGVDRTLALVHDQHPSALFGPLVALSCPCCNGTNEIEDAAERARREGECRGAILAHLRDGMARLEAWAGIPAGAPRGDGPGFLGWRAAPRSPQEAVRQFRARLRAILFRVWDPIGVSHSIEAADEYDSYLPRVEGLLAKRAPAEAIDAHLERIETERIGTDARANRARRAVAVQMLRALPPRPIL